MAKLVIYTTPKESLVKIILDNGVTVTGVKSVENGRDDANVLDVPDEIVNIGSLLTVEMNGYVTFSNRGLLTIDANNDDNNLFMLDDIHLVPASDGGDSGGGTDPLPPGPANNEPLTIINWVYSTTQPNLMTKAGCGRFTEDCCRELHNRNSPLWGHLKKNPGQNQWNGHAVDAVMLLAFSGSTQAGIYDIIYSTESPEARPVFNYADPPDPNIWYYPPAPITRIEDDPDQQIGYQKPGYQWGTHQHAADQAYARDAHRRRNLENLSNPDGKDHPDRGPSGGKTFKG